MILVDFKKYLEKGATARYSGFELGLAFLFFNRTNYSGIINAGPIGGKRQLSKYKIQCRFNKESIIKKIQRLNNDHDSMLFEASYPDNRTQAMIPLIFLKFCCLLMVLRGSSFIIVSASYTLWAVQVREFLNLWNIIAYSSLRTVTDTLILLKRIKTRVEGEYLRPLSYDFVLKEIIEKKGGRVIINYTLINNYLYHFQKGIVLSFKF